MNLFACPFNKVLSSLFCTCGEESYAVSFICYLEFNSSLLDSVGSDEDSGNEDVLDMEYSEAEAEELKKNAEVMICDIRNIALRGLLLLFMEQILVLNVYCFHRLGCIS